MSDWKENVTGTIPCRPFDMVDVWFRDGDLSSGFASDFYWKIDHDIADIIKYRVRDNKTETPEEKGSFDSMVNNSELPNSSEWEGGDECVFDNKTKREFDNPLLDDEYPNQSAIVHHTFKNKHKFDMVLIEFEDGYCAAVMQECISKPESPEQKAERERDENGEAMWMSFGYYNPKTPTWKSLKPEYAEKWREFAEKFSYKAK